MANRRKGGVSGRNNRIGGGERKQRPSAPKLGDDLVLKGLKGSLSDESTKEVPITKPHHKVAVNRRQVPPDPAKKRRIFGRIQAQTKSQQAAPEDVGIPDVLPWAATISSAGDAVSGPPGMRSAQACEQGQPKGGSLREVVLGLDFGTSSTKIAIRDVTLNRSRVTDFGAFGHAEAPCLLSTAISLDDRGNMGLRGGVQLNALKDRFIKNAFQVHDVEGLPFRVCPMELCTGYLAMAIRLAVADYLEAQSVELEGNNLIWSVNLGLPARDLQNSDLQSAYKQLGVAAWICALGDSNIALGGVRSAVTLAAELVAGSDIPPGGDAILGPEEVSIVPEVVAESEGYCNSDSARVGRVHMLVDVGATTADLCAFILSQQDSIRLFQYTDVRPLGLQQLHHRKLDAARDELGRHLRELSANLDPVLPLPESKAYFKAEKGPLDEVEKGFRGDFSRAFRELLRHAQRQVRDTNAWSGGVPLLVYGGGSQNSLYQDLLEDIAKPSSAKSFGVHDGYDLIHHQVPQDLMFPEACLSEYLRFAVAYGLSYPQDPGTEGGKFKPEPPLPPAPSVGPEFNYRELFVDKDMV